MPKLCVKRHAVTQPLDTSYCFIPLTRGQNAIVDADDFECLSQWNWIASWSKCTNSFYALRRGGIRMHRVILGLGPRECGDHDNRNTLDNRKNNLRKCNRNENVWNRNIQRSNRSGYIGVSWHKKTKKWQVRITNHGKRIHLGYFRNPKEAAKTYDESVKSIHGQFAVLNCHLTVTP